MKVIMPRALSGPKPPVESAPKLWGGLPEAAVRGWHSTTLCLMSLMQTNMLAAAALATDRSLHPGQISDEGCREGRAARKNICSKPQPCGQHRLSKDA